MKKKEGEERKELPDRGKSMHPGVSGIRLLSEREIALVRILQEKRTNTH